MAAQHPVVRMAEDYDRELQDFVAGTFPAVSAKPLVARDARTGERVPIAGLFGASRDAGPWLLDVFHGYARGEHVNASAHIDALVAGDPGGNRQHLIKIAFDFQAPMRRALRLIVPVAREEFLEPLDVCVAARAVAVKLVPGVPGHEEHAVTAENVPIGGLALALAAIRGVGRF